MDRHLFQQAQDNLAKLASKVILAPVREEMATPSPEVVELTEPDTPPSSQKGQSRLGVCRLLLLMLVCRHALHPLVSHLSRL